MSKVTISSFARVVNGATPSTGRPEYYDGDIVWVTPKDLSDQNGKYFSKGERTITQKGYDSCSTEMIPAGNLLMSSRAPIGLLSINTVECCTNQGFKSLVIDSEKCDVEYLYYYLKYHIKEIEALGSGTTFKEVSKASMEQYEVDLPDIDTQKSIAEVLSVLDAKIINNNKISAELERLAKTIYDYWFLQFEFPNEEGKPYKSSGGKMVYNEELKREIPEGWQCKTLKDIASLSMKSVFPDNDIEYNHYSIPSFDESKMPVSESGASIASNKYLVPSESVLVSKLNPQFKRIWLIVETQKNAICSTEFLPVKAGETGLFFLYQLLGSDAFSVHLKQKASSSTGSRKRIDPENCMSFQFAFNEKTAKKYNEKISSIILMANKKASENQQLASLRDWLLPMLMNGQVKFKEGDNI